MRLIGASCDTLTVAVGSAVTTISGEYITFPERLPCGERGICDHTRCSRNIDARPQGSDLRTPLQII